jgi:chromosome segregation ATPase
MADLSTESESGYRRGGSRRSSGGSDGSSFSNRIFSVILLLGLAAAGWFLFVQQEELGEERGRLDQANQRLMVLEERLSATDNAMMQEGQDTKEQIGFWQDEIRKLWAVSNERNKKWIKDNERSINKITASIDGVVASTRNIQAAVDRHESAFEQQQGIIDQLASLELQLQQIVRSQRDLVDKVNKVNASFSQIRGDLSGKVNDNVEAIESIDAYRVTLNTKIRELELRLNQLSP